MNQTSDAFSRIIGHEAAVERLRLMLKNGTFPQALLFHGPRHLGKRTLALAAAAALLGTEALTTHPDFRLVERGRDEKTGKLRKNIAIDEIRGLRERLRMSSLLGGRRVAVIDEADALSEEAGNGLLKTLEEPGSSVFIIITAHDLSKVMPTVRSRMAAVRLRRAADETIVRGLAALGAGQDEAGRYAAFSAGRPGTAVSLRENADVLHWYEAEERRWNAFRRASLRERLSLLSELAPPKADRDEVVHRLRAVFGFWETPLRRELRAGSAAAPRLLRELFDVRSALEVNIQPRLLLERFALAF